MRVRLFRCVALAAGFVLLPERLLAQERQISGQVVRAIGGGPIAEAEISVVGQIRYRAARTNPEGRFTISAPAGDVRLQVRAIGFTRLEVQVPASQSSVTVALDQDVFKLGEVVVTGQATTIERRSATTAIARVSGEDITKVPSPTMEGALAGRVTGVNIQSNSGAPGGGIQMQIRGNSTIRAAADPLYVVDGIVYSNVSLPTGRANIMSGASLSEDDAVNRVADINPADIASIEILKGAAASSIYGSKAANGVVIIRTIRGQPGRPRVNLATRLGTFDLLQKYGSRTFTSEADAVAVFGENAAKYFANGTPATYDHYDQVYGRNPLSYEVVGDVSGGSESTRYFISGTWKHDGGIENNTGFDRQGLRVNVDQAVSGKVDLQVSAVYNRATHQRGWDNNTNNFASAAYGIIYMPSFLDLRPNPDGTYNPPEFGVETNPVQTTDLARNIETTDRFTGGANATYRAWAGEVTNFRLVTGFGADVFERNADLWSPDELFWEAATQWPGSSSELNGRSLNYNWNVNGILGWTPRNGWFRSSTAAGLQFEARELHSSYILGYGLVPGQRNVNQGTYIEGNESLNQEKTLALYASEDLFLLDEKLLVSAGVRAERSSVNGNTQKYFVYPKIGASYRFQGLLGSGSELKLRAAYGETGNQPLFGQKYTTLQTPQIGGLKGFAVSPSAGAPDIEPERLKEEEIGFDLVALGNRLTFEATWFDRNTTNLLLTRVPSPSTGFSGQIINGGRIENWGIELGVGYTPVQTRDIQWILRGTYYSTDSRVRELPVPPFRPPNSGFGGLGVTFIELNQPMTQVIGFGLDENGNRTATEVQLGNTNPDFRLGFTSDFTWKGLNLGVVLDWQQGGTVTNLTQWLYDDAQTAEDYGSDAHTYRIEKCYDTGAISCYIESATFLKWRELNIGYVLPKHWTDALHLGVDNARIGLSARNLLWWTEYSGLDPEVANFGSSAIRSNVDMTPYPPSRSIFFTLSVGF